MIKHQQEVYSWQFMFLGANIDAIKVAASIGINVKSAMTFAANHVGTSSAYAGVSRCLTSYRSGDMQNLEFDKQSYDDQANAGANAKLKGKKTTA